MRITTDRAKRAPEIGHSGERLVEDRKLKEKHHTQAGTAVCTRCGSIGLRKHWFAEPKLIERYAADPTLRYALCPGCDRTEKKHYEGEVLLESPLLGENHEMVYGLIYHTAAKAYHDNPLSRIAVIQDEGNKIYMLTTSRTLAERLGKAFHRSFKGKLEIKPSPEEKYSIVHWRRNEIQ